MLRPQWLIGIVVFLIPYLWINGVFHNPDTYARRMNYWLDVRADTIHGRQMKYANSLSLLVATFHHAASAVGWPMLLGFVVSGAFLFFTRRGLFLALFIPCISYYVIVIERMDFVYARFLLPILWLLSIAVGCTSAFWLRRVRVSGVARAGVIAVVLLPSIAYAWAVNLEMLSDTRYAAEAWFVENAPPRSSVGASSKPQYLPRLAERGLETYVIPMTRASFEHPQPEFIVLTSHDYEEYTAEQAECMDELVAGRLGYKLVAVFRGRFLPRHRSLYGMAAWGTPELGKISPTLLILQRAEN